MKASWDLNPSIMVCSHAPKPLGQLATKNKTVINSLTIITYIVYYLHSVTSEPKQP